MVKLSDFKELSSFNELMKTLDPNKLFKLRMPDGTEYIQPPKVMDEDGVLQEIDDRVPRQDRYEYETDMTILQLCVLEMLTDHVKILLNRDDIIIDTVSSDGSTALQYATNNPWPDVIEIMDLILKKGANPNCLTLCRLSPLQQLLRYVYSEELLYERVNVLLSNRADPNFQCEINDDRYQVYISNNLPLIMLCENNIRDLDLKLKICKALLDAGADPNKNDIVRGIDTKNTPMHAATSSRCIDKTKESEYIDTTFETATFQLMKTYGGIADNNIADETPLSYFFNNFAGSDDIHRQIKELVNAGCNIWTTKQQTLRVDKMYGISKYIDRRLAKETMYELILCLKTKKQLATKTMFGYGKIILEMIGEEKPVYVSDDDDSDFDDVWW